MAADQIRGPRLGSIIKKEFWTEESWCRKVISVTRASVEFQLGTVVVLDVSADAANYVAIPMDTTALVAGTDSAAIIIDEDVAAKVAAAAAAGDAQVDLIAVVKGPIVVSPANLRYAGSTAAYDTAADWDANLALAQGMLETQGVKIVTSFSSSQS